MLVVLCAIQRSFGAPTSQPAAPSPAPAQIPALQKTPPGPADPAPAGRYEQLTLRADPRAPAAASQPAMEASAAIDSTTTFDVRRVAAALGAVIALILALRWVAKHLFASSAAPRSGGAMRVLSRMVVSPKQQVLLVQVGRRVVVVGDSGTQMSPLSEITDADEIAALVGQINQEQSRPGMKGFGALFGRAQDPFHARGAPQAQDEDDEIVDTDGAESSADAAGSEISGLMEKIRNMSSQFRRA
jgi:flagellar biosynthetic protein FliO